MFLFLLFLGEPQLVQHVVRAGTWFGSFPNEVRIRLFFFLLVTQSLPRLFLYSRTPILPSPLLTSNMPANALNRRQGTKFSLVGCTVSPGKLDI